MVHDMVFPIAAFTFIVESIALFSLSTSFGWFLGAVNGDVFPREGVESNAFFSVGQPLAGFLVKLMRLNSHEHGWSDLRKSPSLQRLPREECSASSATVHEVRVISFPRERT